MALRVVFLGGTGNISLPVVRRLVRDGVELTVVNRGLTAASLPAGVHRIRADVRDRAALAATLRGKRFDVAVDWIAFTPEHVAADVELFASSVSQYVFISSATVYRKPSPCFPLVEEAPLGNPHWLYARDKIACEELLRSEHERRGFPVTIVRPSYTYGETWIPTALEGQDYTAVDRLRRGRPLLVPGDGETLWTMTHADDFARAFAGLLANPDAVGEAFHITSDEVLTWNQIAETIARAAGLEPRIAHVPSDLVAAIDPELGAGLLGDKALSLVFDNAKIRRFVPGWRAEIPFAEGVARSLAWFESDPARQVVDAERDKLLNRVLARWEVALPGPTAG